GAGVWRNDGIHQAALFCGGLHALRLDEERRDLWMSGANLAFQVDYGPLDVRGAHIVEEVQTQRGDNAMRSDLYGDNAVGAANARHGGGGPQDGGTHGWVGALADQQSLGLLSEQSC